MTPRNVTYSALTGLITGGSFAPPAPPPPPPPPPAPALVLSASGNATVGAPYSVTLTAANLTALLESTPERVSGPAVTFDPLTVSPAPGELVKLFSMVAAAAGTARIRATAAGGVVSNEIDITVEAAAPPPPPPCRG